MSLRSLEGQWGNETYDLDRFGGVILTRADNDQVQTLQDLKGKTVAAASISGLGSGQMQFREMQNAGMSYINDPKQLVLTSSQGKVVNGVIRGEFDVGFMRTDQVERTKGRDGKLVIASLFKVIEPKASLRVDGGNFPLQSSTPLYWDRVECLCDAACSGRCYKRGAELVACACRSLGTALADCQNEFNETH